MNQSKEILEEELEFGMISCQSWQSTMIIEKQTKKKNKLSQESCVLLKDQSTSTSYKRQG